MNEKNGRKDVSDRSNAKGKPPVWRNPAEDKNASNKAIPKHNSFKQVELVEWL